MNRIPQYATLLQGWAREVLTHLQENFGTEVVNDKLRDLVSGQAGSMLSILLSTVTGLIGGGFAIFNLLSLMVVTPVVGFYLLRDWPTVVRMVELLAALPLSRRDARAGAGGRSHPVRLGARPGAVLPAAGALLRAGADRRRAGPWPDRRPDGRTVVLHSLCWLDHGRRYGHRPGDGAVPALARRDRRRRGAGRSARSWKAT